MGKVFNIADFTDLTDDFIMYSPDRMKESYRKDLLQAYKVPQFSPIERFQMFYLNKSVYEYYDPIHMDQGLSYLPIENHEALEALILHSKYFYLIDQNFLEGIFYSKKGNIPFFIEYLNKVKARICVEEEIKTHLIDEFHPEVLYCYQQQCAKELLSSYHIPSSLHASTPIGYSFQISNLIASNFEKMYSMSIVELLNETLPEYISKCFSKEYLSECYWNYPKNAYFQLLMGGTMDSSIQKFLKDVGNGKIKTHHLYDDLKKLD